VHLAIAGITASSASAVSTAASPCAIVVSNSGTGLPSTPTSTPNSAQPDGPRAVAVYSSLAGPVVGSRLKPVKQVVAGKTDHNHH